MATTASKTSADNATVANPFFNKRSGESLLSAEAKTEQPFFMKSAIQANLSVGAPDDPYEQEAEKVSRQVMSGYDQVAQGRVVKNFLEHDWPLLDRGF